MILYWLRNTSYLAVSEIYICKFIAIYMNEAWKIFNTILKSEVQNYYIFAQEAKVGLTPIC